MKLSDLGKVAELRVAHHPIFDMPRVGTMDNGLSFPCHFVQDDLEAVVNLAIFHARKTLPPGTVFEVRGKSIPTADTTQDFGQVKVSLSEQYADYGIAWYLCEDIQQEPLFKRPVCEAEDCCGYVLIARVKA